ncbi:MAG: N-6 DNA methylase, partial [Candidatus Diapherotrites archaeon]|nr:N-6 DNA methylase [Candidatus Diapherotrites archaeon]
MSGEQISEILDDLKVLFRENEILGRDFDNFLKKIKTETVKNYLLSLKAPSQPEQALKDAFFSINSIFAKYLFKKLHPEVGGESGFVDYLVKDEREEIKLEIKPLFEAEFEKGKFGEIFKRVKKVKLNWEKHKDQIRKYLGRKGNFVVFTNLEEWYFFSKTFSLDEECKYFAKVNLFELIKDFEQIGDFWQYLDRQEELSIKEPLDKKFFNSLKTWVEELRKVKFTVGEKKKTELIIKLINKFIFIQTLDNFWVIKGKYLEEKWITIEREWQAKNKLRILKKFLSEINEYFYELYDTELFREGEDEKTILDYIEKTDENVELFYNKLKLVLGIDYGTTVIGWERGIIQYIFRRIDEDILGKAYETFLAEVRKGQGIYYTPKYITQYIVENTVGKIYDKLLEEIKEKLEKKNFDECKELIQKFVSIRVLDPACGSGSFLIKALRLIWNKYNELIELLNKEERRHNNFRNGLTRSKEDEENSRKISELKKILNFKDKRDLISKIIIRHIYGNDLDANALEVAKVNLWLEAIKLAPAEFKYDRLPEDTNHILPDLEMNLGNGDSLVGLPEDLTIKILKEKHENELKRLFELREEYLDDPTKEEVIKEINEIKKKLRKELDEEFKKYLEENNLPLEILEKTKPFHWALDFWFVFFDENLEPKPKDEQGFDAVIGNPPYVNIYSISQNKEFVKFYQNFFITAQKKFDLYVLFAELSINLLKKGGLHSFIVPDKWMSVPYGYRLRELFLKIKLEEIRDLTSIKVFEDPVVKNVIYIVRNSSPCNTINIKKDFKKWEYESWKLPIKLWMRHPKIMFRILREKDILIIDKIFSRKHRWKEFFYVNWGCRPVPFYEFYITKDDKRFDPKICVKAVKGENIQRYYIKWENTYLRYIPKKLYNPMFPELFENEGIYIKDIGGRGRISAALNEGEFYTTHTVNVSIPWSKVPEHIKKRVPQCSINLSCKYALGIVNSTLITYYYLKYLSDFLHTVPDNVREFPIEISNNTHIMENFVDKIITLKKLQHKFRELWRYYSRKFRNNYRSLGEILLDDKRSVQEGIFDKVWISEASVYPDEIPEKEITKIKEILNKNP